MSQLTAMKKTFLNTIPIGNCQNSRKSLLDGIKLLGKIVGIHFIGAIMTILAAFPASEMTPLSIEPFQPKC